MILEVDNISKYFGGIAALDNVSLEFNSGLVTAIIGSNGSGKTTLFNVIAGFLKPDCGVVRLIGDSTTYSRDSRVLTCLKPYEIARHGVGVLFQNIRVFHNLSALENVAVAARLQPGENVITGFLRPSFVANAENVNLDSAWHYLDFVGLSDKAHIWAGNLSYGQQKLLALARLLASDAKVLLLDELTSGVHPGTVDKLLRLIKVLANDHDRVVIMIEHNYNVVQQVGDGVYLMANGCVEAYGKPAEIILRNDSHKSTMLST